MDENIKPKLLQYIPFHFSFRSDLGVSKAKLCLNSAFSHSAGHPIIFLDGVAIVEFWE
jgi:hypothetical protein